jgi:hypothetical protein
LIEIKKWIFLFSTKNSKIMKFTQVSIFLAFILLGVTQAAPLAQTQDQLNQIECAEHFPTAFSDYQCHTLLVLQCKAGPGLTWLTEAQCIDILDASSNAVVEGGFSIPVPAPEPPITPSTTTIQVIQATSIPEATPPEDNQQPETSDATTPEDNQLPDYNEDTKTYKDIGTAGVAGYTLLTGVGTALAGFAFLQAFGLSTVVATILPVLPEGIAFVDGTAELFYSAELSPYSKIVDPTDYTDVLEYVTGEAFDKVRELIAAFRNTNLLPNAYCVGCSSGQSFTNAVSG